MADTFREVPLEGSLYEPDVEALDVTYAFARRVKNATSYLYNKAALDFQKESFERQEFDRTVPDGYEDIANDVLLYADTPEDMQLMMEAHDKERLDDQIWARASTKKMIGGGLVTVESVVPIFRFLKGTSILSSAINTGATAAITTGSVEALRSTMPGYDPVEGAFNTAAATVLGAGGGALFSSVSKGGAKLLMNGRNRLNEHSQTIIEMRHFEENQERLLAEAPASRAFKDSTDEDLRVSSIFLTQKVSEYENTLSRINSGDEAVSHLDKYGVEKKLREFVDTRDDVLDELTLRRLDSGLTQQIEIDPYNVVSSFADPFDKVMPTPLKSILRVPITSKTPKKLAQALNNFKRASLSIANDSALLLNGHLVGQTLPPSLHVRSKLRVADMIQYEQAQAKIWRQATDAGAGSNMMRKITKSENTLEKWLSRVNTKRITGQQMTAEETQAADLMTKFFDDFRAEAEDFNIMGSRQHVSERLGVKEMKLSLAETKLQNAQSKDYTDSIEYYTSEVKRLKEEVDELRASLEFIESSNLKPSGTTEPFYTREYLKEKIQADEQGPKLFRQKITSFVRENPFGAEYDKKSGLWKYKDMTGDIEAQDRFVNSYIESITSEPGSKSSATLRSTRMPSRVLPIPNADIIDFINQDVVDVMRRYYLRNSAKVEFAKTFGNRSYDDVASELIEDLLDNGMSLKKANELRKDLTILYERVANDVVSDPTTFTNKSVQFLKEFTSVNYLQSSGVTTIGDVPKIIMENGFKDILRGAASAIDSAEYRAQFGKVKSIYGEAAELSLGVTQLDTIENSNVRALGKKWDTIKNTSFVLNGLGPMTVGMKTFSGTLSAHQFIESAMNVADGSASKLQITKSLRYGLSVKNLEEIASKAPVRKTENGLFIANIEEWAEAGISADTIGRFRAAVSNNVGNTILSSTPATRFKYADGKIFFPIKAARKIFPDIEEDAKFPGYAVWENSIMTLPFVFYNWPMSAATNIIQSSAQGQIKNTFGGFATMLGFGYLLAKVRTPDWAWEEMDYDQRFMAAIERSGVSAIYGDIAMTALRAGVQLDLNNPDNDFVRLGYYGKPGYAEAAATVLGAPASQIKDFYDIGDATTRGEYGEALRNFWRVLPFTESMWYKNHSRQLIDDLTR